MGRDSSVFFGGDRSVAPPGSMRKETCKANNSTDENPGTIYKSISFIKSFFSIFFTLCLRLSNNGYFKIISLLFCRCWAPFWKRGFWYFCLSLAEVLHNYATVLLFELVDCWQEYSFVQIWLLFIYFFEMQLHCFKIKNFRLKAMFEFSISLNTSDCEMNWAHLYIFLVLYIYGSIIFFF